MSGRKGGGGRRYTFREDLAIIETLRPREERLASLAKRLGRSPAAMARRYYRLVAEHGDTVSAVIAIAGRDE